MSRRGELDAEGRALWDKVISNVKPLHGRRRTQRKKLVSPAGNLEPKSIHAAQKPSPVKKQGAAKKHMPMAQSQRLVSDAVRIQNNLDSHWDRRFKKGAITPDVSIDLHGTGLAGAHARLDAALEQAVHQNLRVILLVTGKQRLHDRASGEGRGAIASVVRDWLAASRHAGNITAVRNAHPRHGGAGALYIILKRG